MLPSNQRCIASIFDPGSAFAEISNSSSRAAFGQLCRLLTLGKSRTVKGQCELHLDDLLAHGEGNLFIALKGSDLAASLSTLSAAFPEQIYVALSPEYDARDEVRFATRANLANRLHLPLVAVGNVIMHAG